jgi:hypothetical protein
MRHTETFEKASVVSIVDGTITIKKEDNTTRKFTNASLVSVNNDTIVIEYEKPDLKPGLVVEYNDRDRALLCLNEHGDLIAMGINTWDSNPIPQYTNTNFIYITKVLKPSTLSEPLKDILNNAEIIWER